ncbi:hypothetical protein R4E38_18365, partial [Morganella morganii]|uniref:hypothetical protein n=1 Tax=Morganella morganii TaxID=582 RepID=UPI00298EB16D
TPNLMEDFMSKLKKHFSSLKKKCADFLTSKVVSKVIITVFVHLILWAIKLGVIVTLASFGIYIPSL